MSAIIRCRDSIKKDIKLALKLLDIIREEELTFTYKKDYLHFNNYDSITMDTAYVKNVKIVEADNINVTKKSLSLQKIVRPYMSVATAKCKSPRLRATCI